MNPTPLRTTQWTTIQIPITSNAIPQKLFQGAELIRTISIQPGNARDFVYLFLMIGGASAPPILLQQGDTLTMPSGTYEAWYEVLSAPSGVTTLNVNLSSELVAISNRSYLAPTFGGAMGADIAVSRAAAIAYGTRNNADNAAGLQPIGSDQPEDSGHGDFLRAVTGYYNPATGNVERARTPSAFHAFAITVANLSQGTIWTPAAAKKFRCLGFCLSVSQTGPWTLRDGGGDFAVFSLPANTVASSNIAGNGYLSLVANNVLAVSNATGVSANFNGWVYGTEE